MNVDLAGEPLARRLKWRAWVLAAGVGLCQAGFLASSLSASIDLELESLARFPGEISGSLERCLHAGSAPISQLQTFGRPSPGALAGRSLDGASPLKIASLGLSQALPMPECFSVVMWVRMSPDQPSLPLFGFGEPGGDYFFAGTDATGAPTLSFLSREKLTKVHRAESAAANLADNRLHAVVAVVNLGSGLVRLYVDGRPEAATTVSMWRPRQFGSAFALYALQGQTNAAGSDILGLLMPRIIVRELSEQEIAKIVPDQSDSVSESASIDQEIARNLIRDTLMEFWPPEFSYQLRRRPL